MRMRTSRLIAITALLIISGCLYVMCGACDTTTYAPGFSERKFQSIKVGMTEGEVIRILGAPLTVDPAPGYIVWTYGPKDDGTFPAAAGVPVTPPAETCFEADLTGKVRAVIGSYIEVRESEWIGQSLDAVRERFGEPIDVQKNISRKYLWYTKFEGLRGQYVRMIGVDAAGRVSDIRTGRVGYY